jgi:hypothetical protein
MSVPSSIAGISSISALITPTRASCFRISSGIIWCPLIEDITMLKKTPTCKQKIMARPHNLWVKIDGGRDPGVV